MKPARMLVIRGGAIGDFLVTLPVLQALRNRWPEGYIEVAGYPHVANLALEAGIVNRVVSLDKADMARLFAWEAAPPDGLRSWIAGFDIVINFLHDPDGTVSANLKACGPRTLIERSPQVEHRHAAEHFIGALEDLAIYDVDPVPRLGFSPSKGATGDSVFIHPGSGSPKKNWPLEHFLVVAKRIHNLLRQPPVFLFGEADHRVRQRYLHLDPGCPVLEGLDLPSLARELTGSRLFLGNDSGIAHLAAACAVPVLALFGPSDPNLWRPYGDHVTVVRSPDASMGALPVEPVWDAVANLLT